MKNKSKLAILVTEVSLLVFFMGNFVVLYSQDILNNREYFFEFIVGKATLDINILKNTFAIYSQIVFGVYFTTLSEMLMFVSIIFVFFLSFLLMAKILYNIKVKHQPL
jgi:hypothetical protein